MMISTKFVGFKIRQYRLLRSYTQERLAEKVNSTASYIGRVERAEVNITLDMLDRLAHALDTSASSLFEVDSNLTAPVREAVLLLSQLDASKQQKALEILKVIFKEDL